MELKQKALFNANGDIDLSKRSMINGNTTNLNDFNNVKYDWTSRWYRQAMNNFWIPEEINLAQDIKDYRNFSDIERTAFDKILSFLVFLDSLPDRKPSKYWSLYHCQRSQSLSNYSGISGSCSFTVLLLHVRYDLSASKTKRDPVSMENDEHLLRRNEFIGNLYNDFLAHKDPKHLVKTLIANYILEGIYFYSGFMFFYNMGRMGKIPGSVQEIRYINRDENTHLWLFRNILLELQKEQPELFTAEDVREYREMIKHGAEEEMDWAAYVLGDRIAGLNPEMVENYIKYLANLRCKGLNFEPVFEGHDEIPESMKWVDNYSRANDIKTDFFEAKSTAYSKAGAIVDDL